MHSRLIVLAATVLSCLQPALAGAQTPNVGLSAVRARVFDNEDLLFLRPEPFDYFGSAVAAGDFNGDGVEDLATGIPYDDGLLGSGCTDCGGVVVRYGIAGTGLETGLADDFLSQQYGGTQDPAEPGDLFGAALAAGDFNGDGIDDLAVGVPNDLLWVPEYDQFMPRGGVSVHYGGTGGIQLVGEHFLQPGSSGIPLPFEEHRGGPELGSSLAAGDFNGDGFDDLAIGIPDQIAPINCLRGAPTQSGPDSGCAWRPGAVLVAGGGIGGFLPFDGFYMFEGDWGLPDVQEGGDRFGESAAAADFNGDGFDDLAIGVPQEDGVGAVLVVFGSPNSLIFANHRFWGEFDLGQPVELDDRFARTLATGDFDGDGHDDLAIGAPNEDIFSPVHGEMVDAGAVTVLYGAEPGFDLGRKQYFDQDFGDPASGGSWTWDAFGWAMAVGDFDGDGRDDLAVGHHGEDSASGYDSGAATVIMGSPSPGLVAARRRQLSQGLDGLPGGPAQSTRFFGYALAAGDFDADGHSDLAVGAPVEDVGGLVDVGAEMVLHGSLFADGFGTGDARYWDVVAP